MSKIHSPHLRSGWLKPRRVLAWVVLSVGLLVALGGCGKEVSFTGAECSQDLALMEKEMSERLGCIVFSHEKVARAVIYRRENGFWQLYYCVDRARQSCTLSQTAVQFGKVRGAEEIAVIAFPPPEEVNRFQSASDFLAYCASRFDPDRPANPICQNDGTQSSTVESARCWFVFHYRYKRDAGVGECTRWKQDNP